jgi:molecular chaperone IbpA
MQCPAPGILAPAEFSSEVHSHNVARRGDQYGGAERAHRRRQQIPKTATEYLYQGISARPFRRIFSLADYVQVKDASFEDGLLKIDLVREIPKAMKPHRITINGAAPKPTTIEQKKAA